MARYRFTPQIFHIREIEHKYIFQYLIPDPELLETYNDIVSYNKEIKVILVFSTKTLEFPSLALYCAYKSILLYKIDIPENNSFSNSISDNPFGISIRRESCKNSVDITRNNINIFGFTSDHRNVCDLIDVLERMGLSIFHETFVSNNNPGRGQKKHMK